MSIYEKVIAAGITYDNHESDLYIPVNPETRRIVFEYPYRTNVTTFVSQIDGKLWFDVPFAYTPFWDRKPR